MSPPVARWASAPWREGGVDWRSEETKQSLAELRSQAGAWDRDEEGLLRKAQALHEAVRRGLRKPLEP
jgi:hypothetical protein